MKKLINIIFLFSTSTFCFCQDSLTNKTTRFGVGVNYLISTNTKAFVIAPYISYSSLQHKICLGPIIGKTPIQKYVDNIYTGGYIRETKSENNGIVGANIFYQFYPNPPGKIFDLYFENRLSYVLHKAELRVGKTNKKRNIHSIENVAGYGIRIKFLKRLSFYQGFSIGINFKTSNEKSIRIFYKTYQLAPALITGLEFKF
jgi:hypothetical protein